MASKPYTILGTSVGAGGGQDRVVVEGKEGSPPVKFEVICNKEVGGVLDVVVREPVNIGRWLDSTKVRRGQGELEAVVGYVVGAYKEKMEKEANSRCGCDLKKLFEKYEHKILHNVSSGATEVVVKLPDGPSGDGHVSYLKFNRYNEKFCQAELKGPETVYQLYGSREVRSTVTPAPETWVAAVVEVSEHIKKKMLTSMPNPELQAMFYQKLQAIFGPPIGSDHSSATYMKDKLLFTATVPMTYPVTPPPPTIAFPDLQKIFQPPKDSQHDVDTCVKYFADKVDAMSSEQ